MHINDNKKLDKRKIQEEPTVKIERPERAYAYIVRNIASNDLTVCASESLFYPGTHVIAPTRYGLDMGVVIGSISDLNQNKKDYVPGCSQCLGSCKIHPSKDYSEEGQNLLAYGEVEENTVVYGDDKGKVTLGPVPNFEFKKEVFTELEEVNYSTDEEIWDSAFRKPEIVELNGDVEWISRMATPEDMARYQSNLNDEKEAIVICRDRIANLNLNMKLVTAHFLLGEPKALFFFTAEDRVDFRELVKALVAVFRIRIELRQIGVRDEARVLGGLAICGRDFCCHCVSDKLDPVSIKMAKEQNLSLNSMKISGPCGRLLCCLAFEYDFYCEEKQAYPSEGTRLKIGEELFKVTEVNILSRKMTLSGSEGRMFQIPRSEVYFSSENGRWEVSEAFQKDF